MSNMDKYALERTFEEHTEFHGRTKRGVTKDQIYRGMFENTLERIHGYQKHELKMAVNSGWLEKTYIDPDGNGIRTAYLWVEEEMPQRGWFKQLIDKVYRWITGEYERYYGK